MMFAAAAAAGRRLGSAARGAAAVGSEVRAPCQAHQAQMWQQQQRFMSRNIEDTVATGVRVRGSVDQAIGRLTRMLRNENMLMAHKSQFRYEKPAVRRYRERKEAKRRAEKQEIKRLVREALKMKELGY